MIAAAVGVVGLVGTFKNETLKKLLAYLGVGDSAKSLVEIIKKCVNCDELMRQEYDRWTTVPTGGLISYDPGRGANLVPYYI